MKEAFRLFSGGRVSVRALTEELTQRGLASSLGMRLSSKSLGALLRNPFYIGTMLVRGQRFLGRHVPLVKPELFDRVQEVLARSRRPHGGKHRFLFQRLLRCARCGYAIISEERKGYVYYRCHSKSCKGLCFREERLEDLLLAAIPDARLCTEYNSSTMEGRRALLLSRHVDLIVDRDRVEFRPHSEPSIESSSALSPQLSMPF